jgi:hypothetical protein
MRYRSCIEFDFERQGESRADLPEVMLSVGTNGEDPANDVADAIGHLIHFAYRAGVDWRAALTSAQRCVLSDHEDGGKVKRDPRRFPVKEMA